MSDFAALEGRGRPWDGALAPWEMREDSWLVKASVDVEGSSCAFDDLAFGLPYKEDWSKVIVYRSQQGRLHATSRWRKLKSAPIVILLAIAIAIAIRINARFRRLKGLSQRCPAAPPSTVDDLGDDELGDSSLFHFSLLSGKSHTCCFAQYILSPSDIRLISLCSSIDPIGLHHVRQPDLSRRRW